MNETEKREARQRLSEYASRYLKPSKGGFYCCPACNSGTHSGSKSDGAFSIDKRNPEKWHCFSCGAGGDIFDLIGIVEGISSQGEQFKRAAELFGIGNTRTQGGGSYQSAVKDFSSQQPASPTKQPQQYRQPAADRSAQEQDEPETDYTEFFLKAHNDITKTDYAAQRGLTEYTINLFNIGYCASWKHPKTKDNSKVPYTPRLIIPTSKFSYIARDTRPDELITEEGKKFTKQKAGKVHIFNFRAILTGEKPIFITEGEIDAISLVEAGAAAFATGSTANINKLMEQIDNLPHKDIIRQPLIIAMDNDQAGEKAAAQLESEFIKAGICFYRADSNKLYLGCKDANAALIQDKEALKEQITAAELAALEVWAKRQYDYINENSAQAAMQDFINGIRTKAATKAISTGFKELDLQLSGDSSDGGLFEGLYIIGAISSLGKTTLVLQIADQIAAAGNDVLIFSLEMARDELIAKSISRHTIQEVLSGGGDIRNAKTTRGITSLARWKKYNQKEIETINNAMAAYNSYANHIFIFEGIGDYSADTIRSKVEKHIAITGNTPVIIVDYIQILAPQSDKLTDKQAIDKSVLELKRISRDFKAAVIGISSFNRNNYSEAVNMAAFKESGAIEYSSDVLIGLQLVGAGEKNFDADKAKKENPRKIELRILKNRNGQTGGRVYFEYYALFNFFRPSVKDFDSETNEPPTKGAKVV